MNDCINGKFIDADIEQALFPFISGDVEIRNLLCGDSVQRGQISLLAVTDQNIEIVLSRAAVMENSGDWKEQILERINLRRELCSLTHSSNSSLCIISARLGMTLTLYRQGLGSIDWSQIKRVVSDSGRSEQPSLSSSDGLPPYAENHSLKEAV
jgi:hypothetical protein